MKFKMVSGGERLLFFYERLCGSDLRVIERQMSERKFDSRLILGTANRCRWGYPRVIVCSPLKEDGAQRRGFVPFPTSFWLTCPWLLRLAGSVESQGGVGDLGQWIEKHAFREWLLFDLDHRLARIALLSPNRLNFLRRFKPRIFDRLRRDGVGGIRYDSHARVKCIHLQAASWLVFRRHPGEEWLKARGIGQDCGGAMKKFCLADSWGR